jgi:lipoprotein-anchoring transpeptidase ErfK/SrfK
MHEVRGLTEIAIDRPPVQWRPYDQTIHIDTVARRLRLISNGSVLYDFQVAVGKPSTPTPVGRFAILQKTMNPGGVFGTRWMRFTDRAHGIHGTDQPWLIGQAVSNGCVRMKNEDVELLYSMVSIGTPVVVTAGTGWWPSGVNDTYSHHAYPYEIYYDVH